MAYRTRQPQSDPMERIGLPNETSAGVRLAAQLLARRLEERCCGTVAETPSVELAIEPALGPEAYRIADGAREGVRLTGGDERGVLYGVGKLLRLASDGSGAFEPGTWRGTSRPAKPRRGIYFATHFHNWYQTAPVEAVERYVEDLALWGMNNLGVWYDMSHFHGFDDPKAVAFRERLRRILGAARRLDLELTLFVIANEAYADSPAELRIRRWGRGAINDSSVCPAKPGGLDYTLRILGEYFDWASDLRPGTVCLWPYDPGGCDCDDCRPWGSHGFVRCLDAVGDLARERLPGVRIMLSTWYMDGNEWAVIAPILKRRPDLVDALLVEHLEGGTPASFAAEAAALGLPVVGFPETSMAGMYPWGGFGANPQTTRFAREWNGKRQTLAGGYPYSEGIFDDLNKVLWLQMYWQGAANVDAVLDEYIADEFSPDVTVVNGVKAVVHTLERNHHFRWWPGKLDGETLPMDWFPSRGAKPQADPGAEKAYAAMREAEARLPEQARRSWRWRILYLRALLDSELKTNGGNPNPACIEALRELNRLYCVTKDTLWTVRPPLLPIESPWPTV